VERTGDSGAWGTASVCKKVTGEPAPKAPLSAAVLFAVCEGKKPLKSRKSVRLRRTPENGKIKLSLFSHKVLTKLFW